MALKVSLSKKCKLNVLPGGHLQHEKASRLTVSSDGALIKLLGLLGKLLSFIARLLMYIWSEFSS